MQINSESGDVSFLIVRLYAPAQGGQKRHFLSSNLIKLGQHNLLHFKEATSKHARMTTRFLYFWKLS